MNDPRGMAETSNLSIGTIMLSVRNMSQVAWP
jgi:hypothetical protein